MLPDHFEENDDLGMSNFDHEIDSGFEEVIKGESVWGTHSASADSLKELMKKVNARYGDK